MIFGMSKNNQFEEKTAMDTQVYKVDGNDDEGISCAASFLRAGELVAIPTETVYGLAADGLNPEACLKIFEAKNRPVDNPLILHVQSIEEVTPLVASIPEEGRRLMEALWPGPLTLIFKRSSLVPDVVTGGGDTVAIRMPSHPIAQQIIKKTGRPLAAPSANVSGRPSPTNAFDVLADMRGRIACVIDGGPSRIGIESTVVDVTTQPVTILRPGLFTQESLQVYLPEVAMDPGLISEAKPRSPGQKYAHYAPKATFKVVVGESPKTRQALKEMGDQYRKMGMKVGIMSFQSQALFPQADLFLSLGDKADLSQMGRVLFEHLRTFDRAGVDVILGEGVEEVGFGLSLMNRIKKAANGRVTYL